MSEKKNDNSDNHDDLTDLDDGRLNGDWKSRYCKDAWVQIIYELIYLCVILLICISLLFSAASGEILNGTLHCNLISLNLPIENAKWIGLALAGAIGGTVFDLKWHYHSVAKGIWNRDRILWRLIVPWNSAMVSLFTGFLLASGIIPFLKNESFDDVFTLMGCGFVFGYFSDNILAALQNFAQKMFGRLGSEE